MPFLGQLRQVAQHEVASGQGISVNKMQKLNQLMSNRRALKPSTFARVNERLNILEDPVPNEGFILLAKEGCTFYVSCVIFC